MVEEEKGEEEVVYSTLKPIVGIVVTTSPICRHGSAIENTSVTVLRGLLLYF